MSATAFARARRMRADLTGAPDAIDSADFEKREKAAHEQAMKNRTEPLSDEEREFIQNAHLLDEKTKPPSPTEMTPNEMRQREVEAFEVAVQNRQHFPSDEEREALSNAHLLPEVVKSVPNPDKEDEARAGQGKRKTRHPVEVSLTETLQFGPDGGPATVKQIQKESEAKAQERIEKEAEIPILDIPDDPTKGATLIGTRDAREVSETFAKDKEKAVAQETEQKIAQAEAEAELRRVENNAELKEAEDRKAVVKEAAKKVGRPPKSE
jgi:hypothetical protein